MPTHSITSFDWPPHLIRESLDGFADGGWGFGGGWPQVWRAVDGTFGGPFGAGAASGTINDRRGGKDLPVFWNEIDLRGFRVLSRWLAETNHFAIGFFGLLVGYNVRKGFGWQACRLGVKKTPYQTVGTPQDKLIAKAQWILDSFRSQNLWPVTSREAFRRWRRDGEVFGRVGSAGWQRIPWFRFVEPEQVGAPDGSTTDPWSFGIDVREYPDGSTDPRDILAYFVRFMDGDGSEGDWVEAREIVHAKANVDSSVKRGLPDLFPLHTELDGARKLLRNMLGTAQDQAGVTWIEKYPSATIDQIRGLIPQQTIGNGQSVPLGNGPYGGPHNQPLYGPGGFRPGDVPPYGKRLKVEGNREFIPAPVATSSEQFLAVVQGVLRACCVRWNFPEYMTGDASNNNLSSSITAGSPFAVTVEGSQLEWGALFEREVALRVLDRAVDAGLLTPDERAQLDVEMTEPSVVTPDPEKDWQRQQGQIQAKVLSRTTAQQQAGLDPQHEAENIKAESQADAENSPQQPGANGTKGADEGDPFGLLGESRVKEAAPGPPPRPGLVWNDATKRWNRPKDSAKNAPPAANNTAAQKLTGPVKSDVKLGAEKLPKSQAKVIVPDVAVEDRADDLLSKIFGGDVKSARAALSASLGFPDDAILQVVDAGKFDTLYSDDLPMPGAVGIRVKIKHPKLSQASRFIGIDSDGKRFIRNEIIVVKSEYQKEGLGADIFSKQAESAASEGIDYIQTHAAGHPGGEMNGYYTWPRFGYDQSLTDPQGIEPDVASIYQEARNRFPDAKTVLDIFSTSEGRQWWKENGTDMLNAKFDLTSQSRSMTILGAYMEERQKSKTSNSPTIKTPPSTPPGPSSTESKNRKSESLVTKTITVHRADGSTFQQRRKVRVDEEPEPHDHIDLSDIHDAKTLEKVKAVAGKVITFARRLVYDAALKSPQILQLYTDLIEGPEDLQKIGYQPFSAGLAGHQTPDALRDHLGIGAHTAMSLAARIGSHAIVWAKAKLAGNAREGIDSGDLAALAELVHALLSAATEQFGLPELQEVGAILKALQAKLVTEPRT